MIILKLTFDEWKAKGFRIKKGSKSIERNAEGKPVFFASQVWNPNDEALYAKESSHWDDFECDAFSQEF